MSECLIEFLRYPLKPMHLEGDSQTNDVYPGTIRYLSRRMGKPTICIGENKGADQLRSNCEADLRL